MGNIIGKYLTFMLNNEIYGIPIQKIREIIGIMDITEVPKTPEYIKGVMNLRGKIIPVIDMRLKLGLNFKEYNNRTCVIVVETMSCDLKKNMGMIVDQVSEVLSIDNGKIELQKQNELHSQLNFLTGIGKLQEKVVLLLDIDKMLNNEECSV